MPASRNRSKSPDKKQSLKRKLDNFKSDKQRRIMENQSLNQLPQTRQFPVWHADEQLSITGRELEALSQFMDNAYAAQMAYQNIINRGLIEGTIELNYEKLAEDGTSYVPMSAEEAAPLREQFQTLVKQAKDIADQAKEKIVAERQEAELTASQKDLPRIDAIVDQTGQEAQSKIIV